jgi:dihydrofolate synthase/folylpolyglutamate synthase
MSYEDAERHLHSLELFGMRFGLDRMRLLMSELGSPEKEFASVHVVGTNGKSSTARMIAAILQRHDLRVGAYLSPHLVSFAERIEVMGEPTTRECFAAAVERAAMAAELVERGLAEGDRVTQFELLTAAAYLELARSGVEVAVVEAGLGGRYDATSVISSRVQVLTNVGLEHTRWLGPTEQHIADEKLAIVPQSGTLVAGLLGDRPLEVATRIASERDATLIRKGLDFTLEEAQGTTFTVVSPHARYSEIALTPLGRFQRTNFAIAVAASEAFLGQELDHDAVRAAARELTLPGRLEVESRDPLVILDGAHNTAGVSALRTALEPLLQGQRLTGVISILDDKDAAGMLSVLMPLCESIVFTHSSHERSLSPATLESLCRQLGGPRSEIEPRPVEALQRAREIAGSDGAVLVTGSIYLLADLAREGVGTAAVVDPR